MDSRRIALFLTFVTSSVKARDMRHEIDLDASFGDAFLGNLFRGMFEVDMPFPEEFKHMERDLEKEERKATRVMRSGEVTSFSDSKVVVKSDEKTHVDETECKNGHCKETVTDSHSFDPEKEAARKRAAAMAAKEEAAEEAAAAKKKANEMEAVAKQKARAAAAAEKLAEDAAVSEKEAELEEAEAATHAESQASFPA